MKCKDVKEMLNLLPNDANILFKINNSIKKNTKIVIKYKSKDYFLEFY